ncbi:LLM class F420-dependent oxidoreductase [Dactylosporangium sp. CA-092794]|uniref:LLM class F420-dependent oxidoreductase n=1 Tax=Dactylosporangium sp. CA-092794 TaxID=3239929 RepID=UPI003D93E570
MKIGVQFFVTGYTVDAATLARALEDAGFESFWAPEHTVLPTKPATPYPMTGGAIPAVYGQMADPFVLLSFVGAATTTLKLGTGVCLVPEHHPLILAKSVSTLDNFSGGRVLFGIGTGWLREVTELFNTAADTPWRYTREAVEAMKRLWRDGSAGYDGELVKFPDVICDPLPVQRPHPPVIIGARPSEAAFKRIAAWGDGWIAMGVTPEDVAAGRRAITAECERIGRDPASIEISVGVRDASPPIQHVFEDAGADRLIVLLYNHPGVPLPMDRWAEAGMAGLAADPPAAADTLRAVEEVHRLARL